MEKRKSGFYWVKYAKGNGEWIVALYCQKSRRWLVRGMPIFDHELGEINENRIMSPDEWE